MATISTRLDPAPAAPKAAEQAPGQFSNDAPVQHGGFGKTLRIFWNMLFNKPRSTRPVGKIPVQPLTREQLLAAPDHSVFRLGHSTVLLKMRGKFWVTDPVFAERASPFSRAGPKRFHQPPISLQELPPLEAVILSHNHYDHLDRNAVIQLADKTRYFLAPLGVGDTLVK